MHFYTWHHECIAPVEHKNSGETAGAAVAAAAAATVASQSLVNIGKDCFWECDEKSGFCPFCGNGNACCRRDYSADAPQECKGALTFTTWHHECVVPINSTKTELFKKMAAIGADAASLAAKNGMSSEEQAKIWGEPEGWEGIPRCMTCVHVYIDLLYLPTYAPQISFIHGVVHPFVSPF